MGTRICIIEDDPTIRELVTAKLKGKGYEVDAFGSADEISPEIPITSWDLYILDVLIYGEKAGLDFCQQLKKEVSTLPILLLSALSEPLDRVEGLRAGADDYLTKPFEMEELLLRVEGMLRRRSWYSEMPGEESTYRWGGNEIDFVSLKGKRNGKSFDLTVKECMLMKLLIQRKDQVVARAEILDKVWGYNVYPSNRTVDNFILRLRKYFEATPGNPKFIHSVRGMGYKFTDGEE